LTGSDRLPHSFIVAAEYSLPSDRGLVRSVMPELDAIRGIAILLVVYYHSFSWSYGKWHFAGIGQVLIQLSRGGWLGVNLFFVLSGFLITGILLDSKKNVNYFGRFYLRRALRILPIYYSLLLVQLVLGWSARSYFLLNLVFLSNLTSIFGVAATYGPLWSLSVEEHYYSVWPFIVRRLNQRQLATCALGLCIATPILRGFWYGLGHRNGPALHFYTWFVIDNLAAGSLLAILVRSQSRKVVCRTCVGLLMAGIVLGTVASPYGLWEIGRFHSLVVAIFQLTFAGVFFGGLLLLFLLVGTSGWSHLVHWSGLKFFGYISYGLYLFHMTAFSVYDVVTARLWPNLLPRNDRFDLVLLRFVLGGGLAVGVSFLSRRYFEEWFLSKKKPLEAKYLAAAASKSD
jgi:peptidoglycan/LPS O-acetylase OafA/YrhL